MVAATVGRDPASVVGCLLCLWAAGGGKRPPEAVGVGGDTAGVDVRDIRCDPQKRSPIVDAARVYLPDFYVVSLTSYLALPFSMCQLPRLPVRVSGSLSPTVC